MSSEDGPTRESSQSTGDAASDVGAHSGDESDVDARSGDDGGSDDPVVLTTEGVAAPTASEDPEPDGFGTEGWLLVGAVVVCFLVIPGVIYLYPYALGAFGLSFFGTYLLLPLVPAILLGLVAVWTMSAAV